MPFFSFAKYSWIFGGTFTDSSIVVNNISNGPSGIDILREASDCDAAYDSHVRDTPPRCYPGTREQYIEDIVNWATPSVAGHTVTPPLLFWMKGQAGVGKSAIAQTCTERLKARSIPCVAFFFSINCRNKHERFFPTIAYQLSSLFPDYRDHVDEMLRHDKTLLTKNMEGQFRSLIVEPLRVLERNRKGVNGRIPIIVDGLDECEGAGNQARIIETISTAIREENTPLCWAFFSRPEPRIEATFSRPEIASITRIVNLPISRNDASGEIVLYLRAGCVDILRTWNLPTDMAWPSEDDIKTLVRAADGLFIFIATVLRFLSQPNWLGPEEPLRIVLDSISGRGGKSSSPNQFGDLDLLSRLILGRIPERMLQHTRLLLFMLVSGWSFEPDRGKGALFLSNFLQLSQMEYTVISNQLRAVLHFQDQRTPFPFSNNNDTGRSPGCTTPTSANTWHTFIHEHLGGSISFYHKSFYDYLHDSMRSWNGPVGPLSSNQDFFARSFSMLQVMPDFVEHCIKINDNYSDSFVFQGKDLVIVDDVPRSTHSLSYPSTNETTNSILKVAVYVAAQIHLRRLSSVPFHKIWNHTEMQRALLELDYHKGFLIETSFLRGEGDEGAKPRRAHTGFVRFEIGIRLFQSTGTGLEKLNFDKVKERIHSLCEVGTLRKLDQKAVIPRTTFQDECESGLYVYGHGGKSLFWYFEFDPRGKRYREFEAVDLARGVDIYQKEGFETWDSVYDE